MLSSVSWGQYLGFIGSVLCLYYGYLGYKYYRWEILSLVGIKKINLDEIQVPVAEIKRKFTESNHADFLPKNIIESQLQPFADEVKAYLYEANPAAPKEELLFAIQQIATKYPASKEMEYRASVNEFIIKEAENHYPGLLQRELISQIWA